MDKINIETISFARSTFQGVCRVGKDLFYPLIQLDDKDEIASALCSCGEEEGRCAHVKKLYERIFTSSYQNLASVYEKSLLRALMLLFFDKTDLSEASCKLDKGILVWSFQELGLEFKGAKGFLEELNEIIINPEVKDETNSLEFSSIPSSELELYQQRRPSHDFRFRLSVFNDVGKFLFVPFIEDKPSVKIHFKNEIWEMSIEFEKTSVKALLTNSMMDELVSYLNPTLTQTPLFIGTLETQVQLKFNERYDELLIEKKAREPFNVFQVLLDHYVYIQDIGFFSKKMDPIFLEKKIENLPQFFQKMEGHLDQLLSGVRFLSVKKSAVYELEMTSSGDLLISLVKVGDTKIHRQTDRLFSPYILINKTLFVEIEGILFDTLEKKIPKFELKSFFARYRAFLSHYPGFELHVASIQENLDYRYHKGKLEFFQKKAEEGLGDTIDAGDYVYVKGSGFYSKSSYEGGSKIVSGLVVEGADLESFIHENRADLNLIKGFFTPSSPLENVRLAIELTDRGTIETHPVMVLKKGIDPDRVEWLGSYTYTQKEGFCEVPSSLKMPVLFSHKNRFGLHELFGLLDLLHASFSGRLDIDPRLQIPEKLRFEVDRLTQSPPYLAGGVYRSELGSCPIAFIKKAFDKGERSLCTPAGLIDLTQERFGFLKHISLNKEGEFALDPLSYYKLQLYESLDFTKALHEHPFVHALKEPSFDKPLDLSLYKSSLRPYQEKGVKWLRNLYELGLSGLLCDEMGLGKTHQAIAFIALLAQVRGALKTLIVCPTSVLFHWEAQLKQFLPGQKIFLFHGPARIFNEETYEDGIILTSYGVLRSDVEMFAKIDFTLAIYDELQIAKNPGSKVYAALSKMKTTMRLGLSGTPIENTLVDLKALFDLIIPRLLPKTAEFKERFLIPIEKNYDKTARIHLNRVTGPFIMRRLKKEVLKDLPEKMETDMLCEMPTVQENLYHQIIREQKAAVLSSLKEDNQGTLHVFALLGKLKQLCDHPYLLDPSIDPYQPEVSGKWDLFIELLQEARDSGQKVVVFSQYLEMLDLIEGYLKKQKIGYSSIRGSSLDRAAQVKRFQEDPTCEVFVGSLLASGVGIDLTSASVVIHYDRWWNPAKEAQATDRVHRIGQSRGVQVFKLITKDTIEERIDWLIKDKLRLMDTLSTEEGPDLFKNFSKKELVQLIESLT